MGAISMVKEHNTNGGRLMESQILIYWFLQFNNKINPPPPPFFFLKVLIYKKHSLLCAASTSTANGVQYEILPVAEKTFPTWGAYLFKSFIVFYSEPFQYHPVHAVVLLMHSMHGE